MGYIGIMEKKMETTRIIKGICIPSPKPLLRTLQGQQRQQELQPLGYQPCEFEGAGNSPKGAMELCSLHWGLQDSYEEPL